MGDEMGISLGLPAVDRVLSTEQRVEFFSRDRDSTHYLYLLYHRCIALSSPLRVVLAVERGWLDPSLVFRLRKSLGTAGGEVTVARAFKPEDLGPTVDSTPTDLDMVVIDPYGFRRGYNSFVSSMRRRDGRTFIFSPMDRTRRGSLWGIHSDHAVLEVVGRGRGLRLVLLKHPMMGEREFQFSRWEILTGTVEEGLTRWTS